MFYLLQQGKHDLHSFTPGEIMTRCLKCGKGETAGGHDWKTGISNQTNPPHKFVNDNRPSDEAEFGYKDRFVKLSHQKEKEKFEQDG